MATSWGRACRHAPLVLVVAHLPALQRDLVAALQAAGYHTSVANDGLEGWCAYELERPDVVVLDLDMPAISGFRLLRLLRSARPSSRPVPAIVITAHDESPTHPPPHVHDSEAYLLKPLCVDRLLDEIGRLSSVPAPA